MAQADFVDWLRETFSVDDEGFDDCLVDDQKLTAAFPVSQSQQMLPDTAMLIQQMQKPLTHDDIPNLADGMVDRDDEEQEHGESPRQKPASNSANQRPKNTKRYKSQAQKDAHKRYRERKRASVSDCCRRRCLGSCICLLRPCETLAQAAACLLLQYAGMMNVSKSPWLFAIPATSSAAADT